MESGLNVRWGSVVRVKRLLMRRSGRFAVLTAACGLALTLVGGCVYNTPDVGTSAIFQAVATVSGTDVWAVGSYQSNQQPHPLIEHFDGRGWSAVAAPSGTGIGFFGITALSASDIYAFSYANVLHWNGRSWGAVTDLNGYILTAMAHGAGGALMAIGFHGPGAPSQVLTHSPSGWTPISTPTPPLPASHRDCDVAVSFSKITMFAATDVWVSGDTSNAATKANCPYAAHWDGAHWKTSTVPTPSGYANSGLVSISERGPHDVWAIGSRTTLSFGGRFESVNSYAVRWDGTAWRTLCNFGCGPDWNQIDATGTGVWVVGNTVFPQDPNTTVRMEIDRWSGSGWVRQAVQSITPAPLPFPINTLSAVSVHGGLVVAVGDFAAGDGFTYRPLVDQRTDR